MEQMTSPHKISQAAASRAVFAIRAAMDAENVMTPNRRRAFERRALAQARTAARREALAREAARVLPAADDRHVFEVAPSDPSAAGVLFADGEVHVFDRTREMHYEYSERVRGTREIASGASAGGEGWGFYVRDGQVRAWQLPAELVDRVQAVLDAYEVPAPAPAPSRPAVAQRQADGVIQSRVNRATGTTVEVTRNGSRYETRCVDHDRAAVYSTARDAKFYAAEPFRYCCRCAERAA